MKIALCFIISYDQILHKEKLWQDWILPNQDIINVYFHYTNYSTISSEWIKKHTIPQKYIVNTTYYHIVPAYISLLLFGLKHDSENQWFCFLTDACCPFVSPLKFREMFLENYKYSIMSWKPAWWNIHVKNRANLKLLTNEYHLSNDPWFILKKEDAFKCVNYSFINKKIYDVICSGIIANESIFAIILHSLERSVGEKMESVDGSRRILKMLKNVKNEVTHAVDWSRMRGPNSPHVFKDGNETDISFLDQFSNKNKYSMFLRKVDKSFPDNLLAKYVTDVFNDPLTINRLRNIRNMEMQLFFMKYRGFLLFVFFIFGYFLYSYI